MPYIVLDALSSSKPPQIDMDFPTQHAIWILCSHSTWAQIFFLETIRFMWVHQFKIPKKTRGLTVANLWCKEFGHSFLLLVPNKIFFKSRVGNSFIQVYDQIWITWDWVHVVVVLKVSTGTPCFDHLGDEISKESEKEHTGASTGTET
jgi:hypothetical protein